MPWNLLTLGPSAPPAYLDPGSGSFLIQLVIAGLLGAALAVRMSWARIKGIFRRKDVSPPDDEQHGE
jgi:hypothetical protein